MKNDDTYWKLILCNGQESAECEQFLEMMAGLTRWRGEDVPDKVGTVKLTQAVTLQPQKEYLLWGRLPSHVPVSPGSTVMVEPTSSKCAPRGIMVGRVITHLWGDGWTPMRVTNITEKPLTLKRNCKLADVSPCMTAEDFTLLQNSCQRENDTDKTTHDQNKTADNTDLKQKLRNLGLGDVDIDGCQVSPSAKSQLVEMLEQYQGVFSKHHLDCGEAKGFVHRISQSAPSSLPLLPLPSPH